MTDVDPVRAELLQPGDLRALVVGSQINVEPVLTRLRLRHAEKEQVRRNTVLRTAAGWFEHDLVRGVVRTSPAKCLLPERGDSLWVAGVDAEALPAHSHARSLDGGRRSRQSVSERPAVISAS